VPKVVLVSDGGEYTKNNQLKLHPSNLTSYITSIYYDFYVVDIFEMKKEVAVGQSNIILPFLISWSS